MARKSIPLEPRYLADQASLERAKAAAILARTGEERLLRVCKRSQAEAFALFFAFIGLLKNL